MIILAMLPLKEVVVDKVEVLAVLEEQIFQIFLRIFLVILGVVDDQEEEETLAIEAQI